MVRLGRHRAEDGLRASLPAARYLALLHLDTSITLPVGVEAYAAYALRAWLGGEHAVSARTRRFAKWSAIFSFALGMAGQAACHLPAQAGAARAPWAVTTIVSCLPVLVLGMGTALAHMLRADAAADAADSQDTGPATARSPDQTAGDQRGPDQHHGTDGWPDPPAAIRRPPRRERGEDHQTMTREPWQALPQTDQVRLIASRLAAAGKPVSQRALRSAGIRGSNETLNALARRIDAESKRDRLP